MNILFRPINNKVYEDSISNNNSEEVSELLASRITKYDDIFVNLKLSNIPNPNLMKNCTYAAERIKQSIENDENILIFTDYDADGCTSLCVLYSALTQIFGVSTTKIRALVGNRKMDGYGLNDKLVQQIIDINPSLIITADVGSSEHKEIEYLTSKNIDVIITDHHVMPEIYPNAYTIVNPHQKGCGYDSRIAGCGVAWLIMLELNNICDIPHNNIYKLLDYVALGTVADVVSMLSPINRTFVKFGLEEINTKNKCCWRIISDNIIDEETLAFQIGPLVNASSRIAGIPYDSVMFLLAIDLKEAEKYYKKLIEYNNIRKQIEQEMTTIANTQHYDFENSIIVYDKTFHSGVQGIVASKLTEKFNKPTIIFSGPDENGILHASGRGGNSLNIINTLIEIDKLYPEILLSFGGHAAAIGLSMNIENFELFRKVFMEISIKYTIELPDAIYIDKSLNKKRISLSLIKQYESLKPFGKDFPKPIFYDSMNVSFCKMVGKENPVHLMMTLNGTRAMKFFAIESPNDQMPIHKNDVVNCIYRIGINEYNGRINPQIIVESFVP